MRRAWVALMLKQSYRPKFLRYYREAKSSAAVTVRLGSRCGGTDVDRTMLRFSVGYQSEGLWCTAVHTAVCKSGLNSEGGASVGWEAFGSTEHSVLHLMQWLL
jgi:hypothetical protein